jgi:hypothetical protein
MLTPDDPKSNHYGFTPATFNRLRALAYDSASFLGLQLAMSPFERLKSLKQNRGSLNTLGYEVQPSALANLRSTLGSPQTCSSTRAPSDCSKAPGALWGSPWPSSAFRSTTTRAYGIWCSTTGSSTTRYGCGHTGGWAAFSKDRCCHQLRYIHHVDCVPA